MKNIRSIIHRWKAAHLRRRAAALQLSLDDYNTIEQARINRIHARADWHEDAAKPALPAAPVLVPVTVSRGRSNPLGRGLSAILTNQKAA
jgi:hypothetical protein